MVCESKKSIGGGERVMEGVDMGYVCKGFGNHNMSYVCKGRGNNLCTYARMVPCSGWRDGQWVGAGGGDLGIYGGKACAQTRKMRKF
jgi:hypothetical protein